MNRYGQLVALLPGLKMDFKLLDVEDLRSNREIMSANKPYKATKRHHYNVTMTLGQESYTSKYYGPVEYICVPKDGWSTDKPVKKKTELEQDLLVSFLWCFLLDSHHLEMEGLKDALDLMQWGDYKNPNDARKTYSALRDAEDGWIRLGLNCYYAQLEEIYEDY